MNTDLVNYDDLVEHISGLYDDAQLHFGHGTERAIDEAWWTVCAASGIDADPDNWDGTSALLDADKKASLKLAQQRIHTREPLAYLINEAWFAGERYYVDQRVIVPRSHLGDWIPDQFKPWLDPDKVRRILDIGTGSGCIAVALAMAFPDAEIVATDLSPDALTVAKINADRHDVSDRISFVLADVYENTHPPFDLIVSNPPYVNDTAMQELPDEYQPEPELAFRGGPDGLDIIHRILSGSIEWLTAEGSLVIEIATARAAFEAAYPNNTLLWLATAAEEDALALISRQQLIELCDDRKT